MIIQENQLRPPSPKEMEARYVPLERINLLWHTKTDDDEDGSARVLGDVSCWDAGFTTLELIEFHKDHVIPYEAFVVADGYDGELALDWTHLTKCETCKQWFLPDTDHTGTDALHLAKVREMTKLLTGEETNDDTEAA